MPCYHCVLAFKIRKSIFNPMILFIKEALNLPGSAATIFSHLHWEHLSEMLQELQSVRHLSHPPPPVDDFSEKRQLSIPIVLALRSRASIFASSSVQNPRFTAEDVFPLNSQIVTCKR
ncbi:hypothetical protein NE237_025202 [Protea cynaroides]|uniref:Uncharacterized protein n=1 Tax=Protea cynaroides TaxID=273540 RepID=A0A9Q0H3R2_9MAGN|nr:hypothetical protein NE237_025202 [Protea cynaroides]